MICKYITFSVFSLCSIFYILFYYLCRSIFIEIMSFIDIILGAFLVFGLIRGLKNGLIVEFASLISFFIGIYIAVKFSSALGDSKTAKVTAFVIILFFVIVGIHLLAKLLSKIASTLFLGWLNKLGGAFFRVSRNSWEITTNQSPCSEQRWKN